jgi:hypothetical protein
VRGLWMLPTMRKPALSGDRASSKVGKPTVPVPVPVAVDGLRLGALRRSGRLPSGLAEAVQQQWWENPEGENPSRDQHRIHERARVAKL